MTGAGRRNLSGNPTGANKPPDSLSPSLTISSPIPPNPTTPLLNLSHLAHKMDSLRSFLSDSIHRHIPLQQHHLHFISAEISSALHQITINGSALLLSSNRLSNHDLKPSDNPSPSSDEIMEIDAAELMAEQIHFCEICGKGFRRDANLRMHMRAHGDRFKTLESLTKPDARVSAGLIDNGRKVRFSCPFVSCIRNRNHPRFRPLKTTVCVRNHFRRSHCPKMYTCDLCNKKSFSVVGDLRSHRKGCGESQWRCSCGTRFSRKDKLFGHVVLFDGHFPVVEEEKGKGVGKMKGKREGREEGSLDDGFFDGLVEEIGAFGRRS